MPSAKEKALRRERILQFIRENRQATPPQVQEKDENSLRQKKRVTFNHGKQQSSPGDVLNVKENKRLFGQGLTSCLITKSSDTRVQAGSAHTPVAGAEKKLSRRGSDSSGNSGFNRRPSDIRITGGENNPVTRSVGKLPRTDSECQFKSPGLDFLKTQNPELSAQEVRLNPVKPIRKELKNKCDFFPKYVDNRPFKDQTTQTLYRESSAQTLAYLPDISNTENAETLELFSLAKLLPGEKPPGLHEVEILERARKRWLFQEAVKINSELLLSEAKSVARKSEFRALIEAFEWEQWIQREESIQECQMIRLQIVIKMFDKREREMHAASKIRIEQACEGIQKKRQAGLLKNEIEYQREMRRLHFKLTKTSGKWKKQSPLQALGSPCSEFYGPIKRHGVDPARRNYHSTTGRRAFDLRIDDLEKRVNMNNVQCPFSKLKQWSKPKEDVREYEQNFCNDGNLQKLYESLKHLRTQADFRLHPKCLKIRLLRTQRSRSTTSSDLYDRKKLARYSSARSSEWKFNQPRGKDAKRLTPPTVPIITRGHQDLENVILTYEGTYIGSIMQFLSDEMNKLKEQRKLHLLSILAQKERWRREASEAGTRQKESDMRLLYEEIFQHSSSELQDTSQQYIDSILPKDIDDILANEAAQTATEMAKQIDVDIERWLESFKLIQTPLTYVPLRLMLRDMVSPDLEAVLKRGENILITQYIVEDVIFERVWEESEPRDVVSTLTSDFIDRLIDNDLYLFSSDSETDSPRSTSWLEAHAIIRKLIRQAVPGRRWMEEAERIMAETFNSLFDDVFEEILDNIENPPGVLPSDLIMVRSDTTMIRLLSEKPQIEKAISIESVENSRYLRGQFLNLVKKYKEDNITKDLQTDERLSADTDNSEISDTFIKSQQFAKKRFTFVVDIIEQDSPLVTPAQPIESASNSQYKGVNEESSEPKNNIELESEEIDLVPTNMEDAENAKDAKEAETAEEAEEAEEAVEAEKAEAVPSADDISIIYSQPHSTIFSFR